MTILQRNVFKTKAQLMTTLNLLVLNCFYIVFYNSQSSVAGGYDKTLVTCSHIVQRVQIPSETYILKIRYL